VKDGGADDDSQQLQTMRRLTKMIFGVIVNHTITAIALECA